MEEFWYVDQGLTVHKEELVALVKDPKNWRRGEIARVESIRPEGPGHFVMNLSFYDGERHDEMTVIPELGSGLEVSPHADAIGIYYRHFKPVNGNPADNRMVERDQALDALVRDHRELQGLFPYLSAEFLDFQYRLIFGEPFPPRTSQNMNGNSRNGCT